MNSIGWSFEEPLSYDDYQKNKTTITTPQFQTDQTNKLFEGLRVDNTIDLPSSHHHQQQCLKESEFDVDELGVERSLMEKKLNHNASERNRRKKMNFLYSTLRSLLPPTNKHQKTQGPNEMDIQILKMKLLVMCEKRKKESYIV
uniref:BHLH domain-containing protein n=1 Tax=Solanum tuberosum TaxID=4113 RepID=M1CXD1_SOLTU